MIYFSIKLFSTFSAFDEFRAASDGINKKLLALKNDISSYDRTDTDSFSREIVDLEKSIKNLQSTILTNRKEISLQAILSINQRYLKLASKWETHKMTLSGKFNCQNEIESLF